MGGSSSKPAATLLVGSPNFGVPVAATVEGARRHAQAKIASLLNNRESLESLCSDLFESISDDGCGGGVSRSGLRMMTQLVIDGCQVSDPVALQELLDVLAPLPSIAQGETDDDNDGPRLGYDGFVCYARCVLRVVDAALRTEVASSSELPKDDGFAPFTATVCAETILEGSPLHISNIEMEEPLRAPDPTPRDELSILESARKEGREDVDTKSSGQFNETSLQRAGPGVGYIPPAANILKVPVSLGGSTTSATTTAVTSAATSPSRLASPKKLYAQCSSESGNAARTISSEPVRLIGSMSKRGPVMPAGQLVTFGGSLVSNCSSSATAGIVANSKLSMATDMSSCSSSTKALSFGVPVVVASAATTDSALRNSSPASARLAIPAPPVVAPSSSEVPLLAMPTEQVRRQASPTRSLRQSVSPTPTATTPGRTTPISAPTEQVRRQASPTRSLRQSVSPTPTATTPGHASPISVSPCVPLSQAVGRQRPPSPVHIGRAVSPSLGGSARTVSPSPAGCLTPPQRLGPTARFSCRVQSPERNTNVPGATSGTAYFGGQGASLTPAISSTALATPFTQMAAQIQSRGASPLRMRQSHLFPNPQGSQMSNRMGGLVNAPTRGFSLVSPNSSAAGSIRESSPESRGRTSFVEARYQSSSVDMLPTRTTSKASLVMDSSNAVGSSGMTFAAPAAQERARFVRHNRASAPPPSTASQRDNEIFRTSRFSGSLTAAHSPTPEPAAPQYSREVTPSVTTCPAPSPAASATSLRNSEASVISFSLNRGSSADVAAGVQLAPQRQGGQQTFVANGVSEAVGFEEVPDVLRQHLDRRKAQLHSMQQRLAKLSHECDSLQGMMTTTESEVPSMTNSVNAPPPANP